jgi:membrane protease subunit (stomatin/prohibitin family)
MAFFDKVSSVAKNISDKTGEAIEITKLNSKISSEKNAIEGVCKKIGEYYYQQHKDGESLPEEVAAMCTEIYGHYMMIDDLKAEIERIKSPGKEEQVTASAPSEPAADGFVCSVCGKANLQGNKFCQECGAKLGESEKVICDCGAEVDPNARFCGVCGKSME